MSHGIDSDGLQSEGKQVTSSDWEEAPRSAGFGWSSASRGKEVGTWVDPIGAPGMQGVDEAGSDLQMVAAAFLEDPISHQRILLYLA